MDKMSKSILEKSLIVAVLFMVVVLTGCEKGGVFPLLNLTNITHNIPNISGEEINVSIPVNMSKNTSSQVLEVEKGMNYTEVIHVIEAVEGQLIRLSPEAYDPDNDTVTFFYGEPFNQEGVWQTEIGDEGSYIVPITASDGHTNVTEYIRVIVKRANRAPIIDCPDNIKVREGEVMELKCYFSDEEGDPLTVQYSGWSNSSKKYIGYDEEGDHIILVTVSDGYHTISKRINVSVENVNRKPVLEVKDINVMEGDIAVINYTVSDPDNDIVKVTFSEPFNQDGVWHTEIGDAGTYNVIVSASDGEDTVEKNIRVIVNMRNTAPVLYVPEEIDVNEGETVRIPVRAYDREDDGLLITFSGWMNSSEKYVDYDEAGVHDVWVTVSDGQFAIKKLVKVIVHNVNRPPIFVKPY